MIASPATPWAPLPIPHLWRPDSIEFWPQPSHRPRGQGLRALSQTNDYRRRTNGFPLTTLHFLDHTADVGFRLLAPTPAQAFIAAAEAMFDIMVDRQAVAAVETWPIEVKASGWEDLLVAWLEELLWLYESEGMLPHSILIGTIEPTGLRAIVEGDTLDRNRHELRVQIKAVTYHQLQAEDTPDGFRIQVIFDI